MTFGTEWALTACVRSPLALIHDAASAPLTFHLVARPHIMVRNSRLLLLLLMFVTITRFQRVCHLFLTFGHRGTAAGARRRRVVRRVGLFPVRHLHRRILPLQPAPGTAGSFLLRSHPVLSPELPAAISPPLSAALLRSPGCAWAPTEPPPCSRPTTSGRSRRCISPSGVAPTGSRSDHPVGAFSVIFAVCNLVAFSCVRCQRLQLIFQSQRLRVRLCLSRQRCAQNNRPV